MSHEIRTPMNAILGMTELVLEGDLSPAEEDYLTTVLDSGESLLNIINEILDFSKIEAGKLDIHPAEFDVREEIGDMVRSLGVRAHRKGIELACEVDDQIPDVLVGDVARLRQVIVNLTGNAIKFTEKGEVVVHVDAVRVDQQEAEIRIRVVDTGIGIPPDKRESIFDAFGQADSSTTRAHGGTGLGLSISATIVRKMGGSIEVESQMGRGSEFSFSVVLPVGKASSAKFRSRPEDLRGMSVLLVDDNDTNLHILEKMMDSWGLHTVAVTSGSKALKRLKAWDQTARPLPIVVSDVHMPEMDGYELVTQIRSEPQIADVSVIVLTSGARPGDFTRCQQLDIVSHLMKPVKQNEMLEAMLDALGNQTVSQRESETARSDVQCAVRPLNILLAEDGIANQKLAVGMLERWGHDVSIAANGAMAVEMYRSGQYDLILMDVQMPIMDGLDATRKIRDLEADSTRHVPIVAMTAHALVGDRQRCLEAGMDHYISKPIQRRLLAEAIEMFTPSDDSQGPSPDNQQPAQQSTQSNSSPPATPENEAESNSTAEGELNLDAALEVMEGQREILVSVVEAFLEETPELFDQLDAALESGDAVAAQRAAHTVKGGFRILVLEDEMEKWGHLEELAKQNKLDEIPEPLETIKESTQRKLEQLQAFVKANRR